jgi:hypothetical protein
MKIVKLLVSVLLLSGSFHIQAEKAPYYTKFHTWALSTTIAYEIYPRVAFLPSRYLLYVDNRLKIKVIGNQEYIKAITQDGVEVYVLSDYVSKDTFIKSVGNHEIIFNSQYQLCNKAPCDNPEENEIWPIYRGDAFSIVKSDVDGFVKIKGRKEEPITGYITPKKLVELQSNGQLTRSDQVHPRYKVKKSLLSNFSTACGQENSGPILLVDKQKEIIEFILKSFDMGTISDSKIHLTSAYGEKDYLFDFYHYDISDVDTGDKFQVAAIYKFYCKKPAIGKMKKIYISNVIFKSSRKVDPIEIDIDEKAFQTSKKLRDHTGAPYLISINSYNHFERIIDSLSKRIGDRTLAGYALSELNVSCRFSQRIKKDGPCFEYDYGK